MSGSAKKQGTLFSFFSKKPSPSASKPKAKAGPIDASAKSAQPPKSNLNQVASKDVKASKKSASGITKKSEREELLASINVGMTLSVFWPADQEYYTAKVTAKKRQPSANSSSNVFTLLYDDGEVETIDLTNEKFKIVKDAQIPTVSQSQSHQKRDNPAESPDAKRGRKRKVIQEDSEEEFEFDDEMEEEEEESEEEYEAPEDEDDDDELESMDVNDEDDEEVVNASKKRVKITSLKSPSLGSSQKKKRTAFASSSGPSTSFITPPPKARKSTSGSRPDNVSNVNAFAAFASDSSTKQSKPTQSERKVTPSSTTPKSLTKTHAGTYTNNTSIPKPQAGVVNPAGTHWHNHFQFLKDPRDRQGRSPSHQDYDHRTLKIDFNEIARVTGSKVTPASQQWWDIKAQYADTVLLFKTGKFYEIFHMDADITVQALNLSYMKGVNAHSGFPEIAYGGFCERLVKAGYKVARVEQTETPEMLKERKKKTKGKKPSVVNREVCSIVSAGTRTFCFMDDLSALNTDDGQGGIGPLLVIKETMIASASGNDENEDEDSVQPVCEYGITLVNAATGAITLGQFADDVLRSRMNTLLTKYRPSEILIEGGSEPCSETLQSLVKSMKNTILPSCIIGKVNTIESFPTSTALDASVRAQLQRSSKVKPWDTEQTLQELHRRGYYPRESRKNPVNDFSDESIGRWPDVLKACVKGGADLAIASFGAALFYLQRSLIDDEILSMGVVKAYIPPDPTTIPVAHNDDAGPAEDSGSPSQISLTQLASEEQRLEDGIDDIETVAFASQDTDDSFESSINHMSLDGTTIANLEILANIHSNTSAGSLWQKVNFTKSPFGSRLLRAWLLRPLFKKADIDRRADAVEELESGAAAAMSEARDVLAKCGDIERLLSRVHSMSGTNPKNGAHHPNERAILYEPEKYTKRKVGDFSKLLNGLRAASQIPEIFEGTEINSGLLNRIVRTTDNGGLFPSKLSQHLDWFFDNFDCDLAAKGKFEPSRGTDEEFDEACDTIDRIIQELEDYKHEMCSSVLKPKHLAKQWKYVNTRGK